MQISSSQLRQKYLDFFRSKNHAIIPSAPLVPENDASVLFNTAGMQPLVPYLLGEKHPMGTRLADVQKCVRTGDIDDVGDDTHHTFFEMLGNWSLGDYFKEDSIKFSWEFLTSLDWLGLDPKMISVTVFEGDANAPRDEESADIWVSLGMPRERIAYLAAEDNWWAAGPTGPCGPDTEIFYWVGEGEPQGNKGTHPKEWMEIWNNVFMQFNKKADGTLENLPAQNVDTGMGLERTLAVINGKKTTYDTDFFINTLEHIRRIVEGADSLLPHPQPFSSQEKGVGKGWNIPKKDWENYEFTKPEIILRAQELRKNSTPSEQILWEILRDRQFLGLKFRRQHPISQYIADFYCAELNLVIELDGKIHEQQREYDHERDELMKKMSITILRFPNAEIENVGAFLTTLQLLISPLLSDPLSGEEREGVRFTQRGIEKYNERSARIIADHLRTAVHMIADGVKPSNTDRGYVLRRLLRRAIREAHKMGHEDACLAQVARDFIHIYQDVYESVKNNETVIIDEITMEESKFQKTIKLGIRELQKVIQDIKKSDTPHRNYFTGEEAFSLFETYGLPIEMIEEFAFEIGFTEKGLHPVPRADFDEAMKNHQNLSRTASAGMFKGGLADHSDITISLHTACHLMLAGLRKVLGTHVMQAGSNITPERLRFDFTHPEKMTPEQIKAVEDYVNGALQSHITVTMTEEPKDNAKTRGVLGAFWEKYPETVKVYKMVGDDGVVYSEELCGGPHIEESSKMGVFKIQKEEASSAGVRRIKAILN